MYKQKNRPGEPSASGAALFHFGVPNELAARRLLPKQTDLTLAVVRDR